MVFVLAGLIGCGDETTGPDPEPVNHAPGQPAINTSAGAPADGSSDKSISSILHWSCTDPDGDALTFDVFFGQNSNPPSMATGHTGTNYSPGTLAYGTTYYWKIIAKDPDGETTGSTVWSFTTMAQPTETVSVPDTPTGPSAGETSQSLSYSTGGATNSLGHTVEYRFDWGDGSYSTWSASTSESYSWVSTGTYSVKAQARCATHINVESAWSAANDVVITETQETVSTPGAVTGPATGTTIETLSYYVSASTSSLGHTVEYRYDWGDGSFSAWSASNGASYNWTTVGSYDVRAQARCRDHTSVVSAWTAVLTVVITEAVETISRPTVTTYPEYGDLGEELSFYAQYAESNLYHQLEYQWDYGDGTISAWVAAGGSGAGGTHTFSAAGAYEVRARARCAEHTDIESDWSNAVTVNIVTGAETVSTPRIYDPVSEEDRTIQVGESITIRQTDASSNLGHELQYRFDFGDGFISPWSNVHYQSYSGYSAIGDYQVKAQARCRDHTDIESAWSDEITIHVLLAESITQPDVSGPATGLLGEEITFTTNGSTSDLGHELEYRLYISTSASSIGNPTEWTTIDALTYTFTQARTWYVRVQARCKIHHHAESNVSHPPLYIVISNP